MSNIHFTPLLILLPLLFINKANAASPVTITLTAGLISDDNITRAELDSDILKDSIIRVSGNADYSIKLGYNSSVTLSGLLELNQYQDFDKLNNTRLGVSASYQLQPETHYTAPWYSITFEWQDWDYDSNMRTGSFMLLALAYGKRLTDRMVLRTGLDFSSRDAESVIFDNDNSRFYLSLDLKLSQRNTLYTTLAYNDGDIVSTVKNNSPATLKLASIPWEIDDAFPPTWWSYKLDATSYSLNIGDNFALASHQSIDASVLYYSSSAYGGSDYTGLIAELNYFYRF